MKYLFIFSTMAGGGNFASYEHAIKQTWSSRDPKELEIYKTLDAQDIYKVCTAFSKRYKDEGVVYICGGDGSFSEAASALAHTQTALGFIPAGSCNDFARTLYDDYQNDPSKLHQLVKHLILKSPQPELKTLDLFSFRINREDASKQYALNVISFGLDSHVLKDSYDYMKAHPSAPAKKAYNRAVINNVFKQSATEARIELYGAHGSKVIEGTLSLAAFCNGGFYGNGYNPSPMADPSDKSFEFCAGQKLSPLDFGLLAPKYKRGTHLENNKIYFETQLESARIRCPEKENALANYDGTLFSFNSLYIDLEKAVLKWAALA